MSEITLNVFMISHNAGLVKLFSYFLFCVKWEWRVFLSSRRQEGSSLVAKKSVISGDPSCRRDDKKTRRLPT